MKVIIHMMNKPKILTDLFWYNKITHLLSEVFRLLGNQIRGLVSSQT